MLRPLGTNQLAVLTALAERDCWFPGCGWHWQNTSTTVRHMEAFTKRGLATLTRVPYPPFISSGTYRRWDITPAGREAVAHLSRRTPAAS